VDLENNVVLLTPEYVGGRWLIDDGSSSPTVRQKLEASGTLILLDVKSATEVVERIDKELDALKEMREAFAAFCEQNAPATSGNKHKMNNAEVYSMIGEIMREAKAKAEAEVAAARIELGLEPPKALGDGASVHGEKEEEDKGIKIRTELGIMEFTDKGLRLTRPNGPKGEMFAKIERLFDKIAGNLLSGGTSDGFHAIKSITTWTNRSPSWFAEKAG
jgi:hypothetical protein